MNPLIVIPARLASTRLRHKPLADIHGKPMILHCWERAVASGIGPVVVAAGDAEICDVVVSAGGSCVLTDPNLPKGTDRIFVALKSVDPDRRHDVIVNMQGDQPTTEPEFLTTLLEPLADPAVDVATLVVPFAGDIADPNVVKVVMARIDGRRGRCLYFSRQPVPHQGPHYMHLGFYAYRRTALDRYGVLPRGPLELSEDLEQLRLLEVGCRYDAMVVDTAPLSVDTPAELEQARRIIAEQAASGRYPKHPTAASGVSQTSANSPSPETSRRSKMRLSCS